ncbi:MAG TPA: HEPN domain-containing protein [Bacilli bacterium]|nr:HEPN domain-containing protein [Bacilli bacterium]
MAENFPQSAGRHLLDAMVLADNKRWDNAVYHAGYVPECAFKVLLEEYMDDKAVVKKYGHQLTHMEGIAFDRLRMMFPEVDAKFPKSRLDGTVLAEGHPERRYENSHRWTEEQALAAVERARQIYEEVILERVLDGRIKREEMDV